MATLQAVHPGPAQREAVITAAIVVASLVGVFAGWMPWHSLALGVIETRGFERLEGKVLVGSLAFAAILAGYHLVAEGPLLARTLVAATGVGTGAAGFYLYDMAKPESTLHDFGKTVLGGTMHPGVLVASAAAVTAFVLALSALRRSR